MTDVMPSGVVVPLNSHADAEAFLVLSGAKQVLLPGARGLEWIDVRRATMSKCCEACGTPSGTGPARVDLVITTARLGRWFQEVGRPATSTPLPPAPGDLARVLEVSTRYVWTRAFSC